MKSAFPVLKPCPFCGREVKMFGGPEDWTPTAWDPDSGGDPYAVVCECGAQSIDDFDPEKVAYWWNRRVES